MTDSKVVLARGGRPDPLADFPEQDGRLPDSDVAIRDLVGILIRRKWIVISAVVLSLAVTAVGLYSRTPVYRARAVIRLEDTQRAVAGSLDPDLGAMTTSYRTDFLLTQLEVLRSAQVLGEVVDREGLRLVTFEGGSPPPFLEDVEIPAELASETIAIAFEPDGVLVSAPPAPGTRAPYGAPIEVAGIRFRVGWRPEGENEARLVVIARQRAIGPLAGGLRAVRREYTDMVDVDYTATSPELAARVANAIVEEFRERNISTARQRSQRRRLFLETQLTDADSLLVEAQQRLTAFRSRERVYSSGERLGAQQAGLMDLVVRREELSANRQMYGSILEALEGAAPGEVGEHLQSFAASPEIAGNQVVSSLFNQLLSFEAARDSLLSGPWAVAASHPDVRRIEDQIRNTTSRITTAFHGYLATMDAQVAALEGLRAQASASLASLPEIEVEESRLVETVRSIQRTVDQLSEEYQRARIAEAVEAGQVEVIDLAAIPGGPESTGTTSRLAVGLLLGLILGGAAAYLRESLDTRINQRDEMERALRVTSVGVIPRIPAQGWGLSGVGKILGLGGREAQADRSGGPTSELVIVAQRASPYAEAFRSLRTNLLFSDAVQSLRTLVVTSPIAAEGKTTTAANLAVAYAQQGLKVLLVDCDLRRARLHRLLGLPREPGLTELVLGRATWEDARHEASVENLDFLGSGARPPNPSELLGSPRMLEFIGKVRERYDLVILDTPPLTAGPDAAILGSCCDGVVLIVRAGRTEREPAQQAVRQLQAVGARIVGAVLNDPDGELAKYGRYYPGQYEYAAERRD